MKNINDQIHNSYNLKPELLIMDELKWKLMVRSALRSKNMLLVGPTGCGKTFAAECLAESLNRNSVFFKINLGSSQDPRSTLIGNTHFDKDKGTYFAESLFIKAIRTKNAIILLDELSRAHPEAHNILMPVLDGQRYIRLDEKNDHETIQVADGVTFIATANIGNEYTATRQLDRALGDRFQKIEVNTLTAEQEYDLLVKMYPDADTELLRQISEISSATRLHAFSEEQRLTNFLSTRFSVEMAGLANDGFSLTEIAEAAIYPEFDKDGGVDSERTFVKQLVQKYITDDDVDENPFEDPQF
jgi:MoxR-like ATPase